MPIIFEGPGESATPPAEQPPSGGIIYSNVPEASYGQVLADVPEKVGLSFIKAGAGATRALADLLRQESISDVAGEIARNAQGAADTMTPGEMTLGQQILTGGAESAGQMLPALATGGAALLPAGIALAAGTQAGSRYTELRDAGFSGGRAGFHAAIDGLAEGLGEFVGLPVLASASRPFLNKLVHFAARDLVGEEFTTVMQQGNAMLSDKPNMTWGEFLEGMKMTALTTPVAAGMQTVAAHAAQRIRAAAMPREMAVPDFQTPVMEKPAVTPESAPEGTPKPVTTTSPTAETIVDTPPEKPAVTMEAPDTTFPMPTPWKTMDGNIYFNTTSDLSDWRIQKTSTGKWLLASDDGQTGIRTFNHLSEAYQYAEHLGLNLTQEQMPEGWIRDLHFGNWIYTTPEGSQYSITGHPGSWVLTPIDLKSPYHESAKSTATSIKEAAEQFASDIAQFAQPVNVPFLSSMYDVTPDEMEKRGQYDPRLYHGVMLNQNPIGVDYNQATGKWTIYIHDQRGAGRTTSYATPERTIEELQKITGLDLIKDKQKLRTAYTDQILSSLQKNPNIKLSDSVKEYFGKENVSDIRTGAIRQLANLDFKATPMFNGVDAMSNYTKGGAAIRGRITDINGKEYIIKSAVDMKSLAPGMYIGHKDYESNPQARKVIQFLEHLRKIFLPNLKLIFVPGDMMRELLGNPGTGFSARITEDTAIINAVGLLGRGTRTTKDMQQIITAAAHEFGHMVIAEHYYRADPRTQAKLLASYYKYTEKVKKDTSLHDYLVEHQFEPRNVRPQDLIRTHQADSEYMMSFSEYTADQAAAYFLDREAARFADPEVKKWYDGLLASLKLLWSHIGKSYKENTTYYDWLDSLAGPRYKASSTGGPTPGPGPSPNQPVPPKAFPAVISDVDQAEKLSKKAGDLMGALFDAGATKEEVDALSPTGLIGDIDWAAAEALADKYGVPKSYWKGMGRYGPGQTDDTTALREGLFYMAQKMSNKETKEEIGKTNAAIKGFNWLLQKTMTAVQLRKRFGQAIPGVKAFVDSLEKMFAYRSRWKERADNTVKEMQGLSHDERNRVFDLLLEEDKTGEFAAKLDRDITGKRTFSLLPEAIKKYKLTEQGVSLYTRIREDFDAALEELELQAEAELRRVYSPGEALTKALAELKDGFTQMKARPYVPHTRFGDHTLTVRTPEGAVREFYQFDSEREAKAHEARLRAEYGNTARISRGKMSDVQKIMAGLPPQLVNAMKAQLNLTTEQIAKFEDILKDMTHGAAFVRRFKRRKDIKGWADDAEQMPRAYADYMSRFANHVSRLKYNHVLSAATSSVRTQAVDESKLGMNTVELNDLASWLSRLQDYVNQPGTEYANARAAATIWYLGLNVKSALVNSTSVPMVTLPFLSKRFGWTRAFDGITQAYKDIAKQYTRVNSLAPDERKMLQSLREAGLIDASFASELAGLREGGRLSDQTALSKPAAAFFGVKYWAMLPFQKMEVVNREVTALAAYRLARKQRGFAEDDPHGFDQAAAEFASRSIQDTQNENAQWNRSEMMRGRKSILTMFMAYQQNLIYQMYGGDESWMRLLAAQMLMAGMLGIPFAQDLDWLIQAFARKVFGSDVSAEKAVRAILKDTMVDADWFLKGLSHNIGGLDLSGSLSQGRVIPGMEALTMEGKFADRLANAAGDVGGAGFSILMNAMKTAASNDPASWKKFSRMMPEFARSIVEGGEMFSGAARDGKGNKIADTSTGDAFMRSLGFQISNVASERDKRFAQRDTAQFWLTRRAYVLAIWEKALESRDPSMRTKAEQALRNFNDEAPDRALRITGDQLRESMKRRATSQALTERDIGPNRTVQETYRRIGELYQ